MPLRVFIMKYIDELQKPGHVYHATAIWRVESILEQGLRVDLGKKTKEGRPYQCLSYSLKTALEMARITNETVMRSSGIWVLGAMGFATYILPRETLHHLDEDPGLPGGLITYRDFPAGSIDQVIVANLREEKPDYTVQRICEAKQPVIDVQHLRYLRDGSFIPI